MANGKKTILIYQDWMYQFEQLTDSEAGQLIKHIFRYVNDLNPVAPSRIIEISFEPIKQSLKRDLKKWEATIEKRSKAGLASAEQRKQNQHMLTRVDTDQQEATKPTDKDKDKDKYKDKEVVLPPPPEKIEPKSFENQLFYNLEAMKESNHWDKLKEYVYQQTHKSPTKDKFFVGDVVVKYNLHLEEKRLWQLGLTPKQFGAGVSKWVMNEEKFAK